MKKYYQAPEIEVIVSTIHHFMDKSPGILGPGGMNANEDKSFDEEEIIKETNPSLWDD